MLTAFVTCARCAHIQCEMFDPEAEARHPDHTRGEDCAFSIAGHANFLAITADRLQVAESVEQAHSVLLESLPQELREDCDLRRVVLAARRMRASESDDDEFDPEDAWWLENERDQWEERGYLCPERVDRFIWDAHAEGGRITATLGRRRFGRYR